MTIRYAPPPRTKVLIAVAPEKIERLERVLEGHDLRQVSAVAEAMRELNAETFGMVIVSVHFDDSQMFTLLGDIRMHSSYRKVPMLVVLGESGRALSEIAIQGLDHAVKAMTANGFLDLRHFPDHDEGNARIRRIVDYLILINGDLQHLARGGQQVVDFEERRRSGTG